MRARACIVSEQVSLSSCTNVHPFIRQSLPLRLRERECRFHFERASARDADNGFSLPLFLRLYRCARGMVDDSKLNADLRTAVVFRVISAPWIVRIALSAI